MGAVEASMAAVGLAAAAFVGAEEVRAVRTAVWLPEACTAAVLKACTAAVQKVTMVVQKVTMVVQRLKVGTAVPKVTTAVRRQKATMAGNMRMERMAAVIITAAPTSLKI